MNAITPLIRQQDLFDHVLDTYLNASNQVTNHDLYASVVKRAGLPDEVLSESVPVGVAGQRHNLFKRITRWHQQSLRQMKIIERVPDARGIWQLASKNKAGLSEARLGVHLVGFSTSLGVAIWGACETALAGLDQPITLCVCSPPYLLAKGRSYGNPADEQTYIDFICRALEPIVDHLAPGGSICLNISNDVFEKGLPSRSLYCERLLIKLSDRFGLKLMDRLIWSNPSKAPGPVAYASKTRNQLNVGWEPIYWLTNDPSRVRSDNRRVLEEHTKRHMALIAGGGETREALYGDGAYHIRPGAFGNQTAGRIPKNVITRGHRCADTLRYRTDAKALGLPIHGAMQPLSIPDFLIRLLTTEGDLVVDPFGGTVKTGMAAEKLGRRWIVIEKMLDYLRGSAERFRGFEGFEIAQSMSDWPLSRRGTRPRAEC